MSASTILSGLVLSTIGLANEPLDTIALPQLELDRRFAVCEVLDLRYSMEAEACVTHESPCDEVVSSPLCEALGLAYDEAACTCAQAPASCEPEPPSDPCEELGWYDDGFCDLACAQPDPDCSAGDGPPDTDDWCAQEGWYGDGICDADCPSPDPDCAE